MSKITPFPFPVIVGPLDRPGLWIDTFPESSAGHRLTANSLHVAVRACDKMGANLVNGVLYVSLSLELAAWHALTTLNTSILARHISTICIDDRLENDHQWTKPWALAFGDVICVSSGETP